MHMVRAAWAAACLLVPVLAGDAAGQDHPITCSYVQLQCLQECGKEARATICNRYCSRKVNECMRTGSWVGQYGDPFTAHNLIRQ